MNNPLMPRTHRPDLASSRRPCLVRRRHLVLSILCASLAGGAVATCLAVRPAVAGTAGEAASPASSEPLREAPAVLAGAKAGAGIGELVVDASFTDLDGKPGRLRDYRGHPMVVCMTSVGCPVAKKYGPTLAEMEARYRDKGVEFLLVNPSASESTEQMRRALQSLHDSGFAGRYAADPKAVVARALGASSTTEVFVFDAARTLVYRGAIDDQYGLGYDRPGPRTRYLADAVEATLAGQAPPVAATSAPGCALDFGGEGAGGAPAAPITWNNQVARLVQRRCQECHRPGEAAPFSLLRYEQAKDHLAMIKKVVRRGTMPPWFADPGAGEMEAKHPAHPAPTHSPTTAPADPEPTAASFPPIHWANDRSLSAREKADLVAWCEAGAPEGDPADAPLPRQWAPGWTIGKPDAIYEPAAPVSVPAKGPIPYRYVVVDPKLTEDKWVKAMEIRCSAPQVVHHLLVFVMYPKNDPRGRQHPDPRGGLNGYFAGLVPGQAATHFPPGCAKLLPKGATLLFQIHYTPDGTATQDRPKIGVIFADQKDSPNGGPPEHEVVTLAAANAKFSIPPGADNYPVRAGYIFQGPVRLLSFNPHSHLRGKAFRYELVYPDSTTRLVLDVPRYDFNWQLEYQLREPIDVPEGARLRVTAWYDNSAANPGNPDPKSTVRFGEQTTDEMMIGYFTGYRLP